MLEKSRLFLDMESYITELQERIRLEIERIDGDQFQEFNWEHEDGGGGRTLTLSEGQCFEKAGCNISVMQSTMNEEMAGLLKTEQKPFNVVGLSLVFHPRSPLIPTVHMNVRYFEMENDNWFGGGVDLTPYYPFKDDFIHFHKLTKEGVDSVMPEKYQNYKDTCDRYFYLKHRDEMRGIGGVFMDYLKGTDQEQRINFKLIKSVGDHFLPSYLPIVVKRMKEEFPSSEMAKHAKEYQLHRRGRYVEFNLLYDRGTVFGLKSGGRVNSILMSLPPQVSYPLEETFLPKSPVHALMKDYYQPRSWV